MSDRQRIVIAGAGDQEVRVTQTVPLRIVNLIFVPLYSPAFLLAMSSLY